MEQQIKEYDDNDGDDDISSLTFRDTEKLYASVVTVDCARGNSEAANISSNKNNNRKFSRQQRQQDRRRLGCVPCAYKIGGFHSYFDPEFTKQCPNKRPEECPRSGQRRDRLQVVHQQQHSGIVEEDRIPGFQPGMNVLTIGDGDFSFSLGLARQLCSSTEKRSFVVATSYEKESTLRQVYGGAFNQTVEELKSLGVRLAFEVDATSLAETLLPKSILGDEELVGDDIRKKPSRKFHRICWNFPCTAIAEGQDGQNQQMQDNQRLIRGFVQSARPLSGQISGEIHICHKTKPPYNQWKLEEQVELGLTEQDDNEIQKQQALTSSSKVLLPDLRYEGRIVLDRFLIKPYTPRKALDRKSFPCHDACFYVFAAVVNGNEKNNLGTTTNAHERSEVSFLPTVSVEQDGDDGDDESNTASQSLVRVDNELIRSIREHHLAMAHVTGRKRLQTHGGIKKRKAFSAGAAMDPSFASQIVTSNVRKKTKNKRRR
mmetsp:Transcript_21659/g.51158  ORF Transcript_21659/g.51158 Transcript_21659/m.51158 type:complete len:487 (+) Transcript_21659:59-1519(+)